MKKYILLFLMVCVFVISAVAQKEIKSGSFQFSFTNTKDKKVERIVLDNSSQKVDEAICNILVVNLFPDEYSVTVSYKFHNVLQTATQKITIDEGKRVVCTLNEQNQLSFSTQNDVSSMYLVVDPAIINSTIGAFTNMTNTMVQMRQNDVNEMNNNHNNNNHNHNHNNHNNDSGHNYNSNQNNQSSVVVIEQTTISSDDFNNMYASLKSESFENDRVVALKTTADFYDLFTSEQIKKLATLFTYEDKKLEIVKYLAPKVIDRQNLPLLKDCFTYSSTKNDYLEFIKNLPK